MCWQIAATSKSLLNPPGNPKAYFWARPARQENPDAWLEQPVKHNGSWWPHWLEWIAARSGDKKPAPGALGSGQYSALDDAPGQYVMEK